MKRDHCTLRRRLKRMKVAEKAWLPNYRVETDAVNRAAHAQR